MEKNIRLKCNNPACREIESEIKILKQEEKNLQHKINVLDCNKADQLIDLTERISELNEKITFLMKEIEKYNKENFSKLGFFELNVIENSLMSLLTKIKKKISEKEEKILKKEKQISISEDCRICLNEQIDTILLPCNHLCVCTQCGPFVSFCPECNVKVNSYERIFTDQ